MRACARLYDNKRLLSEYVRSFDSGKRMRSAVSSLLLQSTVASCCDCVLGAKMLRLQALLVLLVVSVVCFDYVCYVAPEL